MLFLYVICLLKFPDSKLWTWHFGSAVLLEFQVGTKTPFSRTSKTFSLQWYAAGQSNCWAFTVDSFSRETKLSNHKMTMVCKIWGFRPSHNASPQSSNDSFKHFKVSFPHTASKHRKKVQKLKYFICCPNKFRMNIFQEIRQIEGICDLTGFFCFLAFRNLLGVWGTTQLFPKVLRTKIDNLAGCVSRCHLFSVTQLFPSNKFNVHWIWQLCKYYFRRWKRRNLKL